MAYKRTGIPFFELANAAYASATVTFFQVDDTTNAQLATLITLYAAKTGATTYSNPYTLDSDGKFSAPVYADERFIAVLNDTDGNSHTTGIWEPALSTADVAAAAASATASAASSASSAASATSASISEVAAAASAALAAASVGTVSVTSTDVTTGRLNSKINVTAPLTKSVSTPTGDAKLELGVTIATTAQMLAKTSNTVLLVPANLANLNADDVTTGLVRFATAAEAAAGTVTTAALTPALNYYTEGGTKTASFNIAANKEYCVDLVAAATNVTGTLYAAPVDGERIKVTVLGNGSNTFTLNGTTNAVKINNTASYDGTVTKTGVLFARYRGTTATWITGFAPFIA